MWKKRRASVFMCKKISELHGLNPHTILSRYFDASSPSVNAKDILNRMDIYVRKVDFAPLEDELYIKGKDQILGLAASSGDDVIILYSEILDPVMANYVLAHELAHCCLHLPVSTEFHVELKTRDDIYQIPRESSSDFFKVPSDNALREQDADQFTAQLLIPDILLNKIKSYADPPDATTVSTILGVPQKIALMRLTSL